MYCRKGFWILVIALIPFTLLAERKGRFMSYPDIRKEKVVFSFENDIWIVSSSGGTAIRLTTHPGTEYAAKISPDGTQIAFTGNYHNGQNVYVIPIEGGNPKRLTFRSSSQVVSWTPDSKKIIYRASNENTFRPIVKLYAVSHEGSMPAKLPVPRGVLCSFSPDGRKMVYNRRGREEYYWKRYKGGQFQDIWLYDFDKETFTQLTTYVGKNSYPMWVGSKMYFVSDRGKYGIANLYSYDFESKKIDQITDYRDFDVQMPSSDGRQIVFLHSGYINILDTENSQVKKIDILLPTDNWQLAERTVNSKSYIHSMSIANNGEKAIFEGRGDIYFVSADNDTPPENITKTCGSRERYPQISPDGKWIAFFSDLSGEYELYMKKIGTADNWIRLTNGLEQTIYHLEWSPDSKKILFGDKDFTIYYIDLNSKRLCTVDASNQLKNDEFYWEISDYVWSPDSKWIAYSLVQFNRNSMIFLYNLETKKKVAVTDDFYDNINPGFDANGEYLYFLSYRNFDVRMDVFEDNHVIPNPVKVLAVQLKAGQKPPFNDSEEDSKNAKNEPFRIDINEIQERVYELPVKGGNYFYLKAGHGIVTWASTEDFGEDEYDSIFKPTGRDAYNLHIFNMEEAKETVLKSKISDWRLSLNGEYILIKKGTNYFAETVGKLFASRDLGGELNLDAMYYTFEPRCEWTQIFNDTWRWYRDFFYAPNMHGRDWKKIGDSYRTYLPELNSRGDLNWLLSQMVGELCVSHTYIWGGDEGPQNTPDDPVQTGLLGAELERSESGFYRFKTIFGPTRYDRNVRSPLVRPDFDIRKGDFLIAINGKKIQYPENPYKLLQITNGEKVTLTVNRKPTATEVKTFKIQPIFSENSLRYNRWLADNIDKVTKESNGDLGYMHITAMGSGNTAQFDKFWRAFRYKKGIIIDVRGNGGGWTEYFLIDKLERKMVAYNCLKKMVPFRYPGSVSNGHLVVLTNEYNGSDGEAFVEHFKARKLGTVIGVPSWGGLVGIINGQTTIDNGTVHQSNNAFYVREEKWLVENHGADPDILVENDPASAVRGEDKQLETAIQLLLKKIDEEPFTFPEKPAYPVK
jgi:tricorn protease